MKLRDQFCPLHNLYLFCSSAFKLSHRIFFDAEIPEMWMKGSKIVEILEFHHVCKSRVLLFRSQMVLITFAKVGPDNFSMSGKVGQLIIVCEYQ